MTRAMPLYPDEGTIAAHVVGPKRAKDWPGIAAALWNRGFRAGAITEGSNSGVSTDDLAKVAANSPRVNRNVYQRDQFEAARRVAAARKEGRG